MSNNFRLQLWLGSSPRFIMYVVSVKQRLFANNAASVPN